MPEPIVQGTRIEILEASALLLNGEHIATSNPTEFSDRLIRAYQHKDPEELPQEEHCLRVGYQYVGLTIRLVGEDCSMPNEPFTLYAHAQNWSAKWAEFGGPELIGEPKMRLYSFSSISVPVVYLPEKNGELLGKSIDIIAKERALAMIEISSSPPGPNAYSDFAGLVLEPCEGMIAKGKIWLMRHHGEGETWWELYEMERDNDDFGP